MTDDLSQCRGFQWDEGHAEKNWVQHQVSQGEAEQVFFNRPLVVVEGEQRAEFTQRYYALGQTDARRLLFIVFTIRDNLIRVISARPMSRRERRCTSMPKQQPRKPIPQFDNEAQEQAFWSSHDSTDYVDWSQAQRVTFGWLKPSTQTISLRLPVALLEDLKLLATKRDVGIVSGPNLLS